MPDNQGNPWRITVTRLIRVEMTKRGIGYTDLSLALKSLGVDQSAANLRNKVSRGILGADLFLQIFDAMKVPELEMAEVRNIYENIANAS